jgi:hypothetical protein
MLSVSSSLSSSSPVFSVNEGTDGKLPFAVGCAFGVVSGESGGNGEGDLCSFASPFSYPALLFSTPASSAFPSL